MKGLTIQERYDALKTEYHLIRAALRAGMSDEQNIAHPGSVDKILFLIDERNTLKHHYDTDQLFRIKYKHDAAAEERTSRSSRGCDACGRI